MSAEELKREDLARYYSMPEHLRKHYYICPKCGNVGSRYSTTNARKPCIHCNYRETAKASDIRRIIKK